MSTSSPRPGPHEELADIIADQLNKVSGVQGTQTHIAFRTYSTHDLKQPSAWVWTMTKTHLTAHV